LTCSERIPLSVSALADYALSKFPVAMKESWICFAGGESFWRFVAGGFGILFIAQASSISAC
jgi:hypothetical protein